MELVRRYLKYDFEKGISNQQKCRARGLAFGLGIDSDNNLVGKSKQMCDECKFLQYFFNRLNNIILSSPQDNESALRAFRGAHEKAILYMGHRLCVLNQQVAIEKTLDSMRQNFLNGITECFVTIDYKMKLDPIYYREKTVDNYGKKGMIWYGAMMQYYTMEETDGIRTPQLTKYYMDQIIDNENKQDKLAVFSLLEAVIIGIEEKLPEFSKIILRSDNAGCYQNTLLMLFIPYLAYTHGKKITRFLHTEAQDGKCVLDAHFASSMQGITV